jgi:hypothetical protein
VPPGSDLELRGAICALTHSSPAPRDRLGEGDGVGEWLPVRVGLGDGDEVGEVVVGDGSGEAVVSDGLGLSVEGLVSAGLGLVVSDGLTMIEGLADGLVSNMARKLADTTAAWPDPEPHGEAA